MYCSDCFEGSISDRKIVEKSGFLDFIEEGDLVLADRGFTIRDLLVKKGADLVIPPFLGRRKSLTLREEALTKVISKARIHIERWNHRMKQFLFVKGPV